MLRPQDVLVVLTQLSWSEREWQRQELGAGVGISPAEVTFSMKRLAESELISESRIRRGRFAKFLIYGVPVIWPATLGSEARGVATAWSVVAIEENQPGAGLVWPHRKGKVRGASVVPLYKSVPEIVQHDVQMHRWLALIDMLRVGAARERRFAEKAISKEIGA